jgi:hypothetical protein
LQPRQLTSRGPNLRWRNAPSLQTCNSVQVKFFLGNHQFMVRDVAALHSFAVPVARLSSSGRNLSAAFSSIQNCRGGRVGC